MSKKWKMLEWIELKMRIARYLDEGGDNETTRDLLIDCCKELEGQELSMLTMEQRVSAAKVKLVLIALILGAVGWHHYFRPVPPPDQYWRDRVVDLWISSDADVYHHDDVNGVPISGSPIIPQ